MSVATQIERIKTNIANAYASAEAKGATIPDVKNSENLPATINSISSGSSSSFLGISLNDALGIINGGSLVKPTTPFNINFDGVNSLGSRIFYYKFYNTKVASVNGGSLQTIGQYAFQYAFSYCGSLTEFLMPNVTTIDAYGMNQVCSNSAGLTTIDFSSLETVLDAGLLSAFYNAKKISSASFPNLTEVESMGLRQGFAGCESLTSFEAPKLQSLGDSSLTVCFENTALASISFPALTSISSSALGDGDYSYAFKNCTALTEIHFRADMQATVEALSGYAAKWGATNATIYFDL